MSEAHLDRTTPEPLFEIISTCRGGGYMYCRTNPPHPKANAKGLYPLHRVIAENKIGRLLHSSEDVHHVDGNKSNNDPSNLVVLDHVEHVELHKRGLAKVACICPVCGASFELQPRLYRLQKKRKGGDEPCCSRRCGTILAVRRKAGSK